MTNTARCPRVRSPALVTPGQMTRGGGGSHTRGHDPSLVTVSSRGESANKANLGAAIPDQGVLELN